MATIVLGIGTSHGPMLSIPSENWADRLPFDQAMTHPFRGREYSFDTLVALRRDEALDQQIEPGVMRSRQEACTAAVGRLREAFAEARVDRVVIFGNDQMEIFTDENLPAFMVYWGADIPNVPYSELQKSRLGPGMAQAEHGHHANHAESYRGDPALGRHVIDRLIDEGFDIAVSNRVPEIPSSRSSGIPHAYGYVFRQIIGRLDVPVLPIFINTFYPPNQPRVPRCMALGQAVVAAIADWPVDERIAVIGSGGLSHFVIDEDLDRGFLDALARGDAEAVGGVSEALMRSGTSELKNWIPLGAAMMAAGLPMSFHDYVPCYRSLAGTGNGMGFACWRQTGISEAGEARP